jgi:hypothetical protein
VISAHNARSSAHRRVSALRSCESMRLYSCSAWICWYRGSRVEDGMGLARKRCCLAAAASRLLISRSCSSFTWERQAGGD